MVKQNNFKAHVLVLHELFLLRSGRL